jgi:hypothetical protein
MIGLCTCQLVCTYIPTWVFHSTFVSVCCWKCVQTTSYFQMESKGSQYIVMCICLEVSDLLRSIVIKQFANQWIMPFPWLNAWPLQYKFCTGKRYYCLGPRNIDKTYTRGKRQNEPLVGRCVKSGPGLSGYGPSYSKLTLIMFVEFIMCGLHVKRSSILSLHYFWKHSAACLALFICGMSSR